VIFDYMLNVEPDVELSEKLQKNGSQIYVMPALQLKNTITYIRALHRFFKVHHEYSIIHGHIPNAAVFYLGAAKRAGVRHRIQHSHNVKGSDVPIKRLRNSLLFLAIPRVATDYAACSLTAGRFLFGDRAVANGDVKIITNAIDIGRFVFNPEARKKLRVELGLDGKFVVGHIGRFSRQKNHRFLLEIFSCIHAVNPDSALLLVGDGELREDIVALVERLGISSSVVFYGNRKNTEDCYSAIDVFVLPSLYEGLPIVGVEAQASGLMCFFSSEITNEIAITARVSFLPLAYSAKRWALEILKAVVLPRSSTDNNLLSYAGYSIDQDAMKLEQYYLYLGDYR
jgi:glycosyltransferase involved in cell wall biosynthesis